MAQCNDPKRGFVALAALDHVQVAHFKDAQRHHAVWEKWLRKGKQWNGELRQIGDPLDVVIFMVVVIAVFVGWFCYLS